MMDARLQEIIDTFKLIEDRAERIEMLISMADRFQTVPAEIASPPYPEEARVPHCESEAFVFAQPLPDGTLKYHFAVENPQGISAMATAVIADKALSGQRLEEVVAVDPGFIYEIFGHELSTGKGLGLTGIISVIQTLTKRHLRQPTASLAQS